MPYSGCDTDRARQSVLVLKCLKLKEQDAKKSNWGHCCRRARASFSVETFKSSSDRPLCILEILKSMGSLRFVYVSQAV